MDKLILNFRGEAAEFHHVVVMRSWVNRRGVAAQQPHFASQVAFARRSFIDSGAINFFSRVPCKGSCAPQARPLSTFLSWQHIERTRKLSWMTAVTMVPSFEARTLHYCSKRVFAIASPSRYTGKNNALASMLPLYATEQSNSLTSVGHMVMWASQRLSYVSPSS